MKKLLKRVVAVTLVVGCMFTLSVTAFAAPGCAEWTDKNVSSYCSTPICDGPSSVTFYVSRNRVRWCIDSSGYKYQETKSDVVRNGCC